MKARRCICFLAIEWGSSPLRSSATLTRPSSMLSTSPALSADNRPPRGTTSLNLNMVHPLVNLLCLRVSDADRPGGGSQDVDVLTCGRSRRRVGEVRTQPEAQTIVRVIQHLGISMRQLAREMEVTMNSLWPKLGGDIVLRDKDIIAAAKAIKVPVKVLRLSGVDAIQYLLDREKAKAP